MSGQYAPMELQTVNLPAAGQRALNAFDPTRARRFIERGLGELTRSRLVLHVEGHAFARKVLRARMGEVLARGGVTLVSRPTAAAALSYLRDHRVDLVISSSLHECRQEAGLADGLLLLDRCRLLFPGTPFVFYTVPGELEAEGAAADAVVYKSGNFEELLATVRRFVPEPREL